MIYLGVSTLAFCLFPGTVYSLDLGEKIRQTVISLFDKKPGVQCDKYTDLQCPNNQVTFWLYTRDRQNDGYKFNPCDEATIRNAPFIRNLPVKVLVHGYTMNKDKAINEELRPAYFKSGDMNIISVDWSPISKEHCYTEAAYSIPTVGKCVAEFLKQVQRLRTDLGQMHMLGHSMGAHVVAWASLDLDLPRVTQFDPALPLFSDSDKHLFRRPRGTMVDVWHSNSGLKGRDDASGTVDLYLNDEMNQPGCSCGEYSSS
ncbi:phospholipase A1-like [Macrosteles quadrilineatus]|uniref:phospholipase A1-like n=1 Tax=Macrosteles quadrilineatus TaxID=74068 RepID=UPI0023E118E5|nr:phospholipase A1-like [Macrosteles quadrilineatus]